MGTLKDVLQYPSARLTQHLRLAIGTVDAPLDVLAFELEEGFNEPYVADITLTSIDKAIDSAACVGRMATFAIDEEASVPSLPGLVAPVVEPARIVHGIVTQWEHLNTSRDEATYKVRIEPRFALLRQRHDSRVFQYKTLKALLTDLLVDHELFERFDIEFALEDTNEEFEQTVMYEESVENFISRHCRRAGVFYYFKQARPDDKARRDTIVFGDNPAAYVRALEVPLMPYSGLSGNWHEAVLTISEMRKLVPASVSLREHNYRAPTDSLGAESYVARNDRSVYGSLKRGNEHHHTVETGRALANARRDELIARQTTFRGTSNVIGMMPGMVVRLTNHELPGAKHGFVITRLITRGSRTQPVINEFEATPSHLTYRPEYIPEKHWRLVSGTLTGVIESGIDGPYAWLDEHGRYRVRPQFLRQAGKSGTNTMPLRLLRPTASYQGGFHAPLLPGTEVRLDCTNGDIDRMYIAGALHDNAHPDIVHGRNGWHTRSVWRSPLQGAKIRFDDRKGQEGVKIATVRKTSSVSLGFLVDSRQRPRGEGLEARTAGHAVMRGEAGIFLTADKQESPNQPHLDMKRAKQQLEAALSRMESLAEAARAAQALAADVERQRQLLAERLDELRQAVLLASAPDGMAFTSGQHLQLATEANLSATAGGHADVGAMKNVSLSAGEGVSLFAWQGPMKAVAQTGKVQVHAQSNAVEIAAQEDIRIISAQGETLIAASQSLTLACDGAYIKLSGGNIEIACPGDLKLKGGSISRGNGASMPTPSFSFGEGKEVLPHDHYFVVRDPTTEEPLPGVRYRLHEPDGTIHEGTTDAEGKTKTVRTGYAQSLLQLELPEEDEQ